MQINVFVCVRVCNRLCLLHLHWIGTLNRKCQWKYLACWWHYVWFLQHLASLPKRISQTWTCRNNNKKERKKNGLRDGSNIFLDLSSHLFSFIKAKGGGGGCNESNSCCLSLPECLKQKMFFLSANDKDALIKFEKKNGGPCDLTYRKFM